MKRPVFKKPSAPQEDVGATAEQFPDDAEEAFQQVASELADTLPPEAGAESFEPQTESDVDHEYVARLEAEVKENYDKYLRAAAELENFKKRAIKERADILKYAGENIARDLLEIADNFQLAFAQNFAEGNDEFLKGFRLIFDRLMSILEQHQVRGESSLGGSFDPTKHQALASVPTGDQPPGTIIEEFKRAYYFKDKLLRPAQVVVSVAESGAVGADGEKSEMNSEDNA